MELTTVSSDGGLNRIHSISSAGKHNLQTYSTISCNIAFQFDSQMWADWFVVAEQALSMYGSRIFFRVASNMTAHHIKPEETRPGSTLLTDRRHPLMVQC